LKLEQKMKFASVRELKNNASELLRRANGGEGILITSHGKPIASLEGISEEGLEDFVLSYHPEVRGTLDSAYKEYKKSGGTSIEEVAARLKKKSAKNPR
jgi:prevent-host-death family protein